MYTKKNGHAKERSVKNHWPMRGRWQLIWSVVQSHHLPVQIITRKRNTRQTYASSFAPHIRPTLSLLNPSLHLHRTRMTASTCRLWCFLSLHQMHTWTATNVSAYLSWLSTLLIWEPPHSFRYEPTVAADHPQTTPTLGQSGQCNQTAPNIVNKICDSNPSEREKPSTPNVAKKPMQEKRTLPSAPVKVGGSVQSKQGKPALATEKGGTQESDQSNQMTPKKAGSWDQSAPDKPSVSGISKLSMKRSLQKEACNVANEEDGDEEMVTPVAHSAVEKMPATYSLTNSVKALQKGQWCRWHGVAHYFVSTKPLSYSFRRYICYSML